ncbi:AFG1-like ATPase-domain-containing protein [Mycena metata]|uniref:AFG1-like ATPase-domain-containing protein n=1 Tax=Mycena metata TaxID=1033252 RepID=A0AAD7HMD3_9AGAR|nr:AFG1-like ATPase-domain-containing protein [Mycena metata]
MTALLRRGIQGNFLAVEFCKAPQPPRHRVRFTLESSRPFASSYWASYSSTLAAPPHSASLPQSIDVLQRYRGMVATGEIQYDEDQIRVIMQLRRLQKGLLDYSPAMVAPHLLDSPETSSAWWTVDASNDFKSPNADSQSIVSVKSHAEELSTLTTPKGLLLTGPPGCGKSFLVDLWLSCIPTPHKTRKHYNQLVLELYRGVWEETQRRMADGRIESSHESERGPWNSSIRSKWRESLKSGTLPLSWRRGTPSHPSRSTPTIAFSVARRLVLHHWLLVFDEIQLLDISSATLLADVLSWYWRMGGVIVGTSNKIPDDIYKHGIQRERLEPFVEALKVRCPVLTMRSQHDWRQHNYNGIDEVGRTWLLFGQEERFLPLLKSFSRSEQEETHRELTVFGRRLRVPWYSGGVGQFTFADLCDDSLGPADYLTLAAHFHTIGISNIPVLTLAAKNQARRFISLIDALYEARCRVVCVAEAKPEELFFPDVPPAETSDVMLAESISETRGGYRPNISAYDGLAMAQNHTPGPNTIALDTLSIFSGQEEQFAFKRALSRLIEMTSPAYSRSAQWAPLADRDRTWERSLSEPSGLDPHFRSIDRPFAEQDDFAAEAAYTPANPGMEQSRPAAPRLKADHVWGVRDDWGKGTDDWGQGAKAYTVQPKRGPDSGLDP